MTEKSIHSFMSFYCSTPINDWTVDNILEYYRMESNEKQIKKLLDYIKKDLQRVEESELGLMKKEKARQILTNWKVFLLDIIIDKTC
jgi:hypothetical protein